MWHRAPYNYFLSLYEASSARVLESNGFVVQWDNMGENMGHKQDRKLYLQTQNPGLIAEDITHIINSMWKI